MDINSNLGRSLKKNLVLSFACLLILFLPALSFAIGGDGYVSATGGKNFFGLSSLEKSAALFIDSHDYPGVIRALKDLRSDISKVTGRAPAIAYDQLPSQKEIVIVGTLGKSPVIDQLIKKKKLDVKDITGKWEAFTIQTIEKPFPGVDKALVVVGSDKRGTIFGIYDISEQIGVSPWYWWADVAIDHKDALFVKDGKYTQSPSVQYRGIFINDEAPALSGWVRAKFGKVKPNEFPFVRDGVANYGHEFYCKIFEVLLRMKANYLWPAMWDNAFNEDDPENPRLADEYGIVMGTSHQEPMIRSQQEWDRRYYKTFGHWDYYKHPEEMESFWREGIKRNKNYESIITMGLRGANDSEMHGDIKDNIAMVENIVSKQRKIIQDELGDKTNQMPQSWCLYKEIMEYYNEGMRVPDDITLLWSDDNWGNLRRLPNEEELKRKGGAGVYYHFDYHGDPRSYEWINTNPIAKIWDQMSLAKQYGADKIWIVNVGHFKGYELPMEYFMNLAWDTKKWTNSNINEYTRLWVTREFGSAYASEITDIISKYTKFNGRRKPESLRPETYSLVNYKEAETVVADFKKIADQAEALSAKLPKEKRDAFYQIVLFPTKTCAIVNDLYLAAAKNNLFANQKRATTNAMAALTQNLFQADTAMMKHYNKVYANGNWNHFMDQTHLGYISWNPPRLNSLDAIKLEKIQAPDSALMGLSVEGSLQSWPGATEEAVLPEFDVFNHKEHDVEIFNRGNLPFDYSIIANVPWLTIRENKGSISNQDKRVTIGLNEDALPEGRSEGILTVKGAGKSIDIKVKGFKPNKKEGIKGFVESNGWISIEAEHFSKNRDQADRKWIKIEDYGLTLSGMRATAPRNAASAIPTKDAPCLEYPLFLFSKDSAQITLITSPVLNFMPKREIRIAVSLDDQAPQYITLVPDRYKVHVSNPDWAKSVVDQVRKAQVGLLISKPGAHTLKVWMVDQGVVLEKILIDTGGLKPSYLGPQESYFAK